METRVPGGYAVVTLQQLANLCALRKANQISFAAFRVWLAAVEQQAKRCQAKGRVRFSLVELARLAGGVGERSLRLRLRELEAAEILFWSETRIEFPTLELPAGAALAEHFGTGLRRPVPIPRRLLRLLAKHTKPAEVIATIAHLVRCLFKRGKAITSQGFVRAEWVSEVFGVSVRAVYATRAWLLKLGVLVQVPVHQLVLNKHGALFQVRAQALAPAEKPVRKFAGPLKKSTRSSTFINQIKINNKPAQRRAPGVQKELSKSPSLRAIVPEDLRRLSRLEPLYRQAIAAGWLARSEQNARNFIAAAVRATCVNGDPARIFVSLVKRQLWHFVSQEQENRALQAFARHERKTGRRFGEELPGAAAGEGRVRKLLASLMAGEAEQPKSACAGPNELSRSITLDRTRAACGGLG